MDEFLVTLSMVLGILLRIGVPFGATFLLARFLKGLDEKWREEAELAHPRETILHEIWLNNPCWAIAGCEKEQCETCPAFQQTEKSCWEIYRENKGLNGKCQECEYRKELLIPMRINIETTRRK
jgi:hypothetical protein